MFKLQNKQTPNPQAISLLNSAFHPQQTILYMRSFDSNNKLITICLSSQNKLIIRQCSIDKNIEVSYESQGLDEADLNNIGYAFFDGDDVFIVFWRDSIFRIYYGPKGQNKLIKLILNQEIQFERCMIELNYSNLVIFGNKKQESKLLILQLNLDTLCIKIINDSKGYSPGFRRQYISVIADGRLYLFGGKDKKNKPCPKMIWVYDMQKGYWFALQMQYPDDENYNQFQTIVISSSRVLIMNKNEYYNQKVNKGWILQIHQSRLTEVSDFIQVKGRNTCIKGQLINFWEKGWKLWGKQIICNKK